MSNCIEKDLRDTNNLAGTNYRAGHIEGASEAVLPLFDSLNKQRSYIEVFARGSKQPEFHVTADKPWVLLKGGPTPEQAKTAGSG